MAAAEIAIIDAAEYPIIQQDTKELTETMAENMEGETFTPFMLDRVKVPGGGSTSFELPTPEGPQEVKEIIGVILFDTKQRAYWSQPLGTGEAGPPDCYSYDLVNGLGDPGGPCKNCPMNQFNSKAQGDGKACKETRDVYVLLKDRSLPIVIQVPPMSLKKYITYKSSLSGSMDRIYGVETSFTLNKQEKNGNKFATIEFRRASRLPKDAIPMAKSFRQGFEQFISYSLEAMSMENGGNGDNGNKEATQGEDKPQFD